MFDLKAWRTLQIKLTQQQMADAMGMPLRTYQDIESGKNPVRPVHMRAAYWVAIVQAANGNGYDDLPEPLKHWIDKVAPNKKPAS